MINTQPTIRRKTLESLNFPSARSFVSAGTETAEPPVKPAPTPTKPEVEPDPNTVPARHPVREPDVAPTPRPPTTCPVRQEM